jgi:hypothetical protein
VYTRLKIFDLYVTIIRIFLHERISEMPSGASCKARGEALRAYEKMAKLIQDVRALGY